MNGDTTHTVQYKHASPLAALPMNKAAQFGFGLLIVFVAFKLWASGWFSVAIFDATETQVPTDGMGDPVGILPFLIDSICLVGILGFSFFSFFRSAIGPIFGGAAAWVAGARAEASAGQAAVSTAVTAASEFDQAARHIKIDPQKLANVVTTLHKRVKALEEWTRLAESIDEIASATNPPPPPQPPTAEELAEEISQLRQQLADANAKPSTRSRSAK